MKATILASIAALALAALGTAQAADVEAGKARAKSCVGCHGANGEGVAANPTLAGMPEGRFLQAMKDYKSGQRKNPTMKMIATQTSDGDAANLAAYYASLKKN